MTSASLLHTVLFGTFIPPNAPGKKILFDERSKRIATMPVHRRKALSREAVIDVLQQHDGDWLTIGMVSAAVGVCDDTAAKVLNSLASEHIASKRFAKSAKPGGKNAVFKLVKKHGTK